MVLGFLIRLLKKIWFMGTSDITVSALVAVPRVQGNKLAWTVTDNWPKDSHYSLGAVEVWGTNVTNDRDHASCVKLGEGLTDFHHAGLAEEETWRYWTRARNKVGVGSYGPWYPVSATAGVASTTLGQAGNAFGLASIDANASANALTIDLKTPAGNTPSAAVPISFAFRNSVLATGTYQVRKITSGLSLVFSSGSNCGVPSGTPFVLWLLLIDDAGTQRIGGAVCTTATVRFPLNEDRLISSTAEGGAGGADSAGVVYTNVAVTSKPFRILGSLTFSDGLASAGLWSVGPDKKQMFGPGVKKPGEEVQTVFNVVYDLVEGTTVMPLDDSTPQITEGNQYLSTDITPTSKASWIEHRVILHCCADDIDRIQGAIFQDSTADAIAASTVALIGANQFAPLIIDHRHIAATESSVTFKVRAGITQADAATKMAINGFTNSGASLLGGKIASSHIITERAA